MAVGDELRKTYAPDGTVYNLGIQNRQVSSNDAQTLASYITNKKPATKTSAHRSSLSSADTGNISSSTGSLDIGNSVQVECHVTFSAASQYAEIALALFDDQGTPSFMGITEIHQFNSDSSWTDGTDYVSARYIFDVGAASNVKALLKTAPSSGDCNIILEPL